MSNMTFEQAEKIDRILKYAIVKNNNGSGDELEPYIIAEKLAMDEDEVTHLFYLLKYVIRFEGNNVLNTFDDTDNLFELNYNTYKFIEAGGAQALFQSELSKQTKEERKKELELTNLETVVKQAKFSKNISIISIIIAILTLAFTIIAYILNLPNKA